MEQPVVRSPSFQDVYSNNITLNMCPSDVTVTFARNTIFNGANIVEELAAVRLSPQTLQVLMKTLVNATSAWQREFGSIPDNVPVLPEDRMAEGLRSIKQSLQDHPGFSNVASSVPPT